MESEVIMHGRRLFATYLAIFLFGALFFACRVSAANGGPGSDKEMMIYFPNYDAYSTNQGKYTGLVRDLPWDRLTTINHAFFNVAPDDNGGYLLRPADEWADIDPRNKKAHFPQYAEMHELYPDVDILISVGGWSNSAYFSPMVATAETRQSFINSCIALMEEYPFISGFDIDWEYLGVKREPNGSDQGNPVAPTDREGFTLLLEEMRDAFALKYGEGVKKISVCLACNPTTIGRMDIVGVSRAVDHLNVMAYDLVSYANGRTGHHSALYSAPSQYYSADRAVSYMLGEGVEPSKIMMGSPLYSRGWGNVDPVNGSWLFAPSSGKSALNASKGENNWHSLKEIEKEALATPLNRKGWHKVYDSKCQAPYMYNDDPSSKYYRNYLSYEDESSLAAKTSYVMEKGLGGLFFWEACGDDATLGYPMITEAATEMGLLGAKAVYRLYNPNSGEHFYTSIKAEREHLVSVGWNDEGVGWFASCYSDRPVYRLYNPRGSEHHYTLDAAEKDMLIKAGWNYEGIGWYSSGNDPTPVYREYNPNQFSCNHNFTTDKAEHDYLISIGWKDEGTAWFADSPGDAG